MGGNLVSVPLGECWEHWQDMGYRSQRIYLLIFSYLGTIVELFQGIWDSTFLIS